jgi:hypothetical protein
MSKSSDHFRRMVRKAVEKSGGNPEVAMQRAQMCASADPVMQEGALEARIEEIGEEVLAANPDISVEECVTKIMAILKEEVAALERKQACNGFFDLDLDVALTFAAADVHPDWERVGEYGLRYTGKRRGQNPMKLLNWFCATYPERRLQSRNRGRSSLPQAPPS